MANKGGRPAGRRGLLDGGAEASRESAQISQSMATNCEIWRSSMRTVRSMGVTGLQTASSSAT